MTRYLAAYIVTVVAVAALDMLWLGVIAKSIYQAGLGHLLAAKPNFLAAMLFYFMFALGLMIFALAPNADNPGWNNVLVAAALFGLFTYATYDLTNLATLKDWPIVVSLIDVGWGALISAVSAAAGKLVMNQFANISA